MRLFVETDEVNVIDSSGIRTKLGISISKLLSSKGDGEGDLLDQSGGFPICKNSESKSVNDPQSSLVTLQSYLLQGNQEEAIKFAIENELWAHALLISSSLNPAALQGVVNRFAYSQLADCSPLQTLYVSKCGQCSSLFVQNVERPQAGRRGSFSDAPLVKNWTSNLAMLLSNPSSNSAQQKAVIIQLGDTLWKYYRHSEAAHVCYLAADEAIDGSRSSRIVLIGGDHISHVRTFFNLSTFYRTEIYEYSRKRKDKYFILSSFQPYKLLYVTLLIDFGFHELAMDYILQIQADVENSDKKLFRNGAGNNISQVVYTTNFLEQLKVLDSRLKNLGAKGGSKKSAVSASKVISSIFNKMTDFFVGGEGEIVQTNAHDAEEFIPVTSKVVSTDSKPQTTPPIDSNTFETPQLAAKQAEITEPAMSTEPDASSSSGTITSLFSLFKKPVPPSNNLENDGKVVWDPEKKKWNIVGGVEAPKPEEKAKPPPSRAISSEAAYSPPPYSGAGPRSVSSRYALPPSMGVSSSSTTGRPRPLPSRFRSELKE